MVRVREATVVRVREATVVRVREATVVREGGCMDWWGK